VRNYWNVDGGKEIGSEASSFGVFPSECLILLAHEVVHEIMFGWPEKAIVLHFDCSTMLISISASWGKWWWIWIESWHVF